MWSVLSCSRVGLLLSFVHLLLTKEVLGENGSVSIHCLKKSHMAQTLSIVTLEVLWDFNLGSSEKKFLCTDCL